VNEYENQETGHGGKRPGAGRKALPEKMKRYPMSFTLSPSAREHIAHQAKVNGWTRSRMVEILILESDWGGNGVEHLGWKEDNIG